MKVVGSNPYAVAVEECYGLDKIEFLQSHENLDIYQKAFDIIEKYFGSEEEDGKLAPQIDNQAQQFQVLFFKWKIMCQIYQPTFILQFQFNPHQESASFQF